MNRLKSILKIVLAVLVVPVGFAAVLFGCMALFALTFTSGDIPHQADEELIANFRSHRADFDRLVQMVTEDKGLERVDQDWTLPKDPGSIGISQARIDEYRMLFRRASVPRGFSAFQTKDYIYFTASSWGLAVSGSSKGYLYAKDPPARLTENIDTYLLRKDKFSPAFPVFRHIEGHWYLCFFAD